MVINFVFFQIHYSSLSIKLEKGCDEQDPIFIGINMSTSFYTLVCGICHSKDQSQYKKKKKYSSSSYSSLEKLSPFSFVFCLSMGTWFTE